MTAPDPVSSGTTSPGTTSPGTDGQEPALAAPLAVPPLAAWHVRAAATLVDVLLLLALTAQVYGLTALALGVSGGLALAVLAVGTLGVLALLVQQQVRLGRTGATIGKRLLGVRVVSLRDGLPLGVLGGLLRPLAHLPDGVLYLGYLLPLVDARRQTLADKLQRSVALQVRREGRLGLLPLLALAQACVLLAGAGTAAALLAEDGAPTTAAGQADPAPPLAPPPSTTAAPPSAPPAPGGAASPDPADLVARIVPPAAGNALLEGEPGLTLVQAAERLTGTEGAETEAQAADLQARGLLSAAVQAFETPDGDVYEVLVVRFATPVESSAALDHLQQFNGDAAPSRAVPGARIYRYEDGDRSLALGDLAVGSYLYEVSAGAGSLEESVELLEAVLAAQAEHAATL